VSRFLFNTVARTDDRLVSRTLDTDGCVLWPVTLDRVKANAQIDLDNHEDDSLLLSKIDASGIIPAAVEYIESAATVALLTQTRRLYWDGLLPDTEALSAGREIELLWRPLVSVQAFTYLDSDYAETVFAASNYRVLGAGTVDVHGVVTVPGSIRSCGRLRLKATVQWPEIIDDAELCWIDYTAGFGNVATAVPMEWKHPVIVLASYWYNHRELYAEKGVDERFYKLLDAMVQRAGGQLRYA